MSTSASPSTRISPRDWFVMAALAITGQIAWAVENSWFNTFVFDSITARPGRVACDLPVDLPRPRSEELRYTPRFAELARRLRGEIE